MPAARQTASHARSLPASCSSRPPFPHFQLGQLGAELLALGGQGGQAGNSLGFAAQAICVFVGRFYGSLEAIGERQLSAVLAIDDVGRVATCPSPEHAAPTLVAASARGIECGFARHAARAFDGLDLLGGLGEPLRSDARSRSSSADPWLRSANSR